MNKGDLIKRAGKINLLKTPLDALSDDGKLSDDEVLKMIKSRYDTAISGSSWYFNEASKKDQAQFIRFCKKELK